MRSRSLCSTACRIHYSLNHLIRSTPNKETNKRTDTYIKTLSPCEKVYLRHEKLTSYCSNNGSQCKRGAERNRKFLNYVMMRTILLSSTTFRRLLAPFLCQGKTNLKTIFCPMLPNIQNISLFFTGSWASIFCPSDKRWY